VCGFNPFNHILLSLFAVLNTFLNFSQLTLKQKCVKQCKQLKYYSEKRV